MGQPIPMIHVRTFLFQSLSGHSIQFDGPSKPAMVAPEAVRECMAIGAAPVDEVNMPSEGPGKNRLERAADEPRGFEREAQIKQAMKDMVGVNDPNSFDANGVPKVHRLNALLSFKVAGDERNNYWPEVKAELNPG